MKCLDETKLLLGDIILSTQDHYVSKAIRTATKSDISHAMLYVARGSIIDSTGEGVHARNTRRLFYDDDCALHVRRLASGLTNEQRDRVIRYARNRIGTRYSTREAMRSATGTDRAPSRQQFCSRLVGQAYASAGIDLVSAPDFCTPDEVKNSPLLTPVPDAVMPVSDEYVRNVERDFDTNEAMREVTNKLLGLARTRHGEIESLRDIDTYLVSNPSEDEKFAMYFEDSGYLTAWEVEFDKNRWQYELPLLVAMPGALGDKRAYCVGTIEDHGDMIVRRDENRAGYTILYREFGLQTFAKLKTLYERLVDLQVTRRAVALQWLEEFAPEIIPGLSNADSLVPHTEEWFAVLTRQNPQQAQFTRMFIEREGSREVCTFCGDSPAANYRAVGVAVQRDTVLTAKLCDDCRGIRKVQFDEEFSPL
jgi:Permuted papain-like amidase enzyme, YaeF/YiiX, C92 family